MFHRPEDTILLTHPHSNHWIGASAFDQTTKLVASKKTRQISKIWGARLEREYKKRAAWNKKIAKLEKQLQTETDERVQASLEKELQRIHYPVAEMAQFQPRYADRSFSETISFPGSQRQVEMCSMGPGHSEDDSVVLLRQEKIGFIGDIGFFDTQPFLGFCDLGLYRQQLHFFRRAEYQVLVPGHGPVGNVRDIELQLEYLDLLEKLVGEVVQKDGAIKDALQINLPEPFDQWLLGGMGRFEANVRYMYKHLGENNQRRAKLCPSYGRRGHR